MANNKTKESTQNIEKNSKTLVIFIICMVAALFICPIICNFSDVRYLVSGGGDVILPTNTIWYHEDYPVDYAFETLSSPNKGNIVTKYGKESVKIEGNKMYKIVGKKKYMGKIRITDEGDIKIYNAADIVVTNGTYKRYNRLIND